MVNKNPFKYFKTSPKIIRLAVMFYVRYPLSYRQVEDILHERGIDMGLLRPTVTDQKLLAPRGPPVFERGVSVHGPLQLVP